MSNKRLKVLIGTPSNGGGGAVNSVFGRTGTVTAQSGDYNTDQVTEATNKYFPEAPNDGQQYARQSEGWTVVSGGGGGGVQSVTGDGVDNTDPENPVLSYPTPSDIGALQSGDNVSDLVNDANYLTTISGSNHSQLTLDDGTNPHGTTKSDVGLSNVDNTSDLSKPISTATQSALDDKVNSVTTGEPIGSDQVINVVSLTQAEYDAGTPVATTFYLITD